MPIFLNLILAYYYPKVTRCFDPAYSLVFLSSHVVCLLALIFFFYLHILLLFVFQSRCTLTTEDFLVFTILCVMFRVQYDLNKTQWERNFLNYNIVDKEYKL